MTGVVTDVTSMADAPIVTRLKAAAADLDRARKHLADVRETRDRLIVEAADQGVSMRAIAAAADLSHPGVNRVLATPHPWLPEVAGK